MTAEAIMRISGMDSRESHLAVINSMRKYSGVLDVDVGPSGREVRVRYDPGNILIEDLKKSVEQEGYKVTSIRS